MKVFITNEQKAELEHLHDTSRDKCVCDGIKAILLASEGWTSAMIAQALRLHETTVNQHINDYVNTRELKPENDGSASRLSIEQTARLISHLSQYLFHHTHEIVAYVEQRWATRFSIFGMNKWLHRHGFAYKKPAGIPHKFSEEKQKQFIESYEDLKKMAGDEPILFIDAVHPTQFSYGWIRKGYKKLVKTTGS